MCPWCDRRNSRAVLGTTIVNARAIFSGEALGVGMPPAGDTSFSVEARATPDSLRVTVSVLRASSVRGPLVISPERPVVGERTTAELGRASAIDVFVTPATTWSEYRPEQNWPGGAALELNFVDPAATRRTDFTRDGLAVARFAKSAEGWRATAPFLPLVSQIGAQRDVFAAFSEVAALAAAFRDRCHEYAVTAAKVKPPAERAARRAIMSGANIRVLGTAAAEPPRAEKKVLDRQLPWVRAVAASAHELSCRLRNPELGVLGALDEIDAFVGAVRLAVGEPPRRGAAFAVEGLTDLTEIFQRARELVTTAIDRVEQELSS